jgi:hypothetical protein
MAVYRLYLSDNLATSPFPTTSRQLKVSAGASAVQHAPGEFDQATVGPGNTDCGQWMPTTNTANTTVSIEIDAVSADQSPTRQGWLWQEQDLTGLTMAAGSITAQLRVSAVQGTGTQGNFFARVSVVSGATGTYETKKSLTPTNIVGEASHSSGQSFWTVDDTGAAFGVSAATNISKTFPVTSHTFAAGERLLFELGFGNADSTTDRTWILESNSTNTFIDTTNIATIYTLTAVPSAGTIHTATPMVMTKNLRPVPVTP